MTASPVLLCLCTCPELETGRRIARALVQERFAACVNILPGIESVYRWQGEVETGAEVLLLAKTVAAGLEALTARIVELHPYDLPEVIAFQAAGGLPGYLDWVAAETGGDGPA